MPRTTYSPHIYNYTSFQPHIHQYLPHLWPRQLGRSIIDLIHNKAQVTVPFPVLLHYINRQDIQVLLSVATHPDQVESINSWISGICKDYSGIISLGAMHPEHPDPEAETMWMRQLGIINFSILPPHQSQKAPARQSAALPHTAVFDTSGSCFAVLIIPLATSRTAPPPINPLHLTPAPHTPVSPPPLTPAAGTKYHRLHPQQSTGHSPLSSTLQPHQPAGHTGLPLSCHQS